jgi:signal transduction histidine kinase/ActR/RegA family two-component response regulator
MQLHQRFAALFLCFFSIFVSAQETTISADSLEVLLDKVDDLYYDYKYIGAMETADLIIKEAEKENDHYYLFKGYINLGQVHYAIKDTALGRHYFNKALEQAVLSKNDTLISWAYNDLGNTYGEDKENYKKTISFYEKAIEVNRDAGFSDSENLVQYMNIGWVYLDSKQHKKAYPFLLKTKNLTKLEKQHPLLLLNMEILFGRYYYYNGQYNIAIKSLKATANTATESNYMEQAAQSQDYLAKAYQKTGNFDLANQALRKQQEFDKKIHAIEKETAMLEASARYEVNEYQKDAEMAQNEQIYAEQLAEKSRSLSSIFIISSIVFLLAFVSILLLAITRKKFIKKLRDTNAELVASKNKAERLSKLKTQFFSTVSHELRTPLYGVIGLSSILLEDKKLDAHRDDLKSLKFSADYLLALINDVLMLNKMDADGISLQRTPFKLSRLVMNISKTFAFSLEQNKSKIHIDIDPEIPDRLLGDSIRLSQVLMNLVGNAVKFNEEGNVWISIEFVETVRKGFHLARFTVKDDGIGIPVAKQSAIFEEFSQVESNNYNYQGTGLGLPIVKKLLALHNSEIELISAPGEGASFIFNLCLEEDLSFDINTQKVIDARRITASETKREPLHILVVDDNKINQKITQKILETRNFTCSLADGGKQAIDLVKENDYSLVLMDIHMPEVGGIEATTAIRTFNKRVPIGEWTAGEADEIRENIFECGMNDIILKPYDVSHFLNTILSNLNNDVGDEK